MIAAFVAKSIASKYLYGIVDPVSVMISESRSTGVSSSGLIALLEQMGVILYALLSNPDIVLEVL